MVDMIDEEHPKAKLGGICRITQIGPTGIEWICVRPVHQKVYKRRSSDYNHRRGALVYSDAGDSLYHVFVNRWPNRKVGE